jgi:hypothetical protein
MMDSLMDSQHMRIDPDEIELYLKKHTVRNAL